MKYILDTNICIYIIKQKPEFVLKRLVRHNPTDIGISIITYFELIYGVHKSSNPEKNLKALKDFIASFEVLDWGESEADSAGKIRASLEKIGKSIGPFDLQIAGQAMANGLILVTNNEKEFSRVKGLKIENWAKEA